MVTHLTAGPAHLELAPAMGGGIARLDVNQRPLLRSWSGDERDFFSLASNILVPFSNRISKAGFEWKDKLYSLEGNTDFDTLPIHGDGFQRPWTVSVHENKARMELLEGAFGPWRYRALQELSLSETSLDILLTLTNTSEHHLPFGCGFHPWFIRNAHTRVHFQAEHVWMEDDRHLPTESLAIAEIPEWSFEHPRPLPDTLINNCYTGWQGVARIDQNSEAVSCTVKASENLDNTIIYSPDGNADFFCFEPVSHPVDAFHLPGYPGLKELAPGESMRSSMTIGWGYST